MSPVLPPVPEAGARRPIAVLQRLGWPQPPHPLLGVLLGLGLAVLGALFAWLLASLLPESAWQVPLAALLGTLVATVPMGVLFIGALQALGHRHPRASGSSPFDAATGIASRPTFMALAEREFSRSRRYGIGAALLLVDVDRFRRLVEGYEPGAADRVLREIAITTQGTLRGADALGRFGHAQLAVFLAHADPLGALDVAERIRERVEQLEVVWADERLRATVSVGVVLMRPVHPALQAVIDDAEAAASAARHAGGNCVRSAPVDNRRQTQPGRGPAVGDNRTAG